jgi:transcriptional regulator with XRE-family HTH domain
MLSTNLKVFRAERDYSQERLADEAGLHRTYVGDIERCEQNPTLGSLEALADAFGIQIGELLLAPCCWLLSSRRVRDAAVKRNVWHGLTTGDATRSGREVERAPTY